jgi:hypothetical protein
MDSWIRNFSHKFVVGATWWRNCVAVNLFLFERSEFSSSKNSEDEMPKQGFEFFLCDKVISPTWVDKKRFSAVT